MQVDLAQQLILIKEVHATAARLCAIDLSVSRLQAVILLDLSVELMLSVVARQSSAVPVAGPKGADPKWHELWKLASEAANSGRWGSILPRRSEMKAVHDMRNLAQHRGVVPAFEELQRHLEPVREFLGTVYKGQFGFDFGSFRRWDVLGKGDLRTLLEQSNDYLAADNFHRAIAGATIGGRKLLTAVEKISRPARRGLHVRLPGSEGASGAGWGTSVQAALHDLGDRILEEVDTVREELHLTSLGFSMGEIRRIGTLGSWFRVNEGHGTIEIVRLEEPGGTDLRAEAEFYLDFLFRLAFRVQEAYPGVVEGVRFQPTLRERLDQRVQAST